MKNNLSLLILLSVNLPFLGQFLYPIPGGWIKQDGKVIELSYADSTFISKNGAARFLTKGKFGCITNDGFESIKPIYYSLTDFNEGIAFAKKETDWVAVNMQGDELFRIVANYVYELNEGLARFQLGNRFGFINNKGEVVIAPTYQGAYDFKEGKARVYVNGKWGFINASGKIVIPAGFDFVADFSQGLAPFMKKTGKMEHWGYLDENGKEKIPAQLGYGFPFKSEYAIFRKGNYREGKLVLIDKNGYIKLEIPYTDAVWCGNGLINVCKRENEQTKWGYISIAGEEIIPFEFETKGDFINGLARVVKKGKIVYINEKGAIIWEQS
jgi:hypothetical protein